MGVKKELRTPIQMYGGFTPTQTSGLSPLYFKGQGNQDSNALTCAVGRVIGSRLSQRLGPSPLTSVTCWNIGLIAACAPTSTASLHRRPKWDKFSHLVIRSPYISRQIAT